MCEKVDYAQGYRKTRNQRDQGNVSHRKKRFPVAANLDLLKYIFAVTINL